MTQAIQFSSTEKKILELISKSRCHLSELAKKTGQPETKILELLARLKALGIVYTTDKNYYYELPQFWDAIDFNQLTQDLSNPRLDFFHFDCIDSTNLFLKRGLFQSPIICCFSEMQTQGRGRFGRPWCSPYGLNIYHSMRLSLHLPSKKLKGLSLVIALALCKAIEQTSTIPKLQIKWPNDLVVQGQKLAGILIDVVEMTETHCQIIIGTGINVNSLPEHMRDIDQAWTSLYQITGAPIPRQVLLMNIIHRIQEFISIYQATGLTTFFSTWAQRDWLFQQKIELVQGQQFLQGIAQGIDEQGQLILKDILGKLHFLDSGEVSIKKKPKSAEKN
jgi:BirA family biotin operon repressor/biotin-[acetyl-CoA-carboxylase] ligase